MKTLFGLLLVGLLMGCNKKGAEGPVSDLKAIQGTWVVQLAVNKYGAFDWVPGEFVFRGTNLTVRFRHHPGGDYTFRLDNNSQPKMMTLMQQPGSTNRASIVFPYHFDRKALVMKLVIPAMQMQRKEDEGMVVVKSVPPPPRFAWRRAKTNILHVHLQEGFAGTAETLVTVEGREIYRGRPETLRFLGVAKGLSTVVTSQMPVVTFSQPTNGVYWSDVVDLRAGTSFGIGLSGTNVKVWQADEFMYE